MKAHIHVPLITRYIVRPPPPAAKTNHEKTDFIDDPLRAVIRRFHRLATLLLVGLMVSVLEVWLMMRVIHPQQPEYSDDLSGYEMLFPGEITDPKDFGFHELGQASDNELSVEPTPEKLQPQLYVNPPGTPTVVIIAVSAKNK